MCMYTCTSMLRPIDWISRLKHTAFHYCNTHGNCMKGSEASNTHVRAQLNQKQWMSTVSARCSHRYYKLTFGKDTIAYMNNHVHSAPQWKRKRTEKKERRITHHTWTIMCIVHHNERRKRTEKKDRRITHHTKTHNNLNSLQKYIWRTVSTA